MLKQNDVEKRKKDRKKRKKLYFYQEKIVQEVLSPTFVKGKAIIPTASGKGVIAREIFLRSINLPFNRYGQFVGVCFSPRLLLNNQWLSDFLDYLSYQEKPVNFIFIGSESISKLLSCEIEKQLYLINGAGVDAPISTLDFKEAQLAVQRNQSRGISTIIISTYHSNHVVKDMKMEFDLIVYDEAHFLPGREDPRGIQTEEEKSHFDSVQIKAKKKLFTTATEKIGNVHDDEEYDGRGMNNIEYYGEEILCWKDGYGTYRRVSPRDLIDYGAILGPIAHIITTDYNVFSCDIDENILNINNLQANNPVREKEFDEKAKIIFQGFLEHEKQLKKDSDYPDKINGKMLVVVSGEGELLGIQQSKEWKRLSEIYGDIRLYSISSASGIIMPDQDLMSNTNKNKEKLLKSFRELEPIDRAIIMHIDIMTCGMDIPALTGVMFFRYCNLIKFLQNIGRAQRLLEEDRRRWELGEISPSKGGYIKPHYQIILPLLFEGGEDFKYRGSRIINELREYYDFKNYEFVHIGNIQPAPKSQDLDNGLSVSLRNFISECERDYIHKIEKRKNRKQKETELLEENLLEDIYKRGSLEELEYYLDTLEL